MNKHTLFPTSISKKFTPTLRQVLDTVRNPHEERSKIIIGVGTNDAKQNIPLGDIRNMLSLILDATNTAYPRATVYVCGVPPSTNISTAKIRAVNEVYKVLCNSRLNVHYIDTFSDLFQFDAKTVTTDGTHINNKGEEILINNIRQGVTKGPIPFTQDSFPPLLIREHQSKAHVSQVPPGVQESRSASHTDYSHQRALPSQVQTQVNQIPERVKDTTSEKKPVCPLQAEIVPLKDSQHQMNQPRFQSPYEIGTTQGVPPLNPVFLPPQQNFAPPYPQVPQQFAPQFYVPPYMYSNTQTQPPMMYYPGAQLAVKA